MAGARYPMEFTIEELDLLAAAVGFDDLDLLNANRPTLDRLEAELRFAVASLRVDAARGLPAPCRRAGDATSAEVGTAVGQSGYGLARAARS